MNTDRAQKVASALNIWAPTWPRKVNRQQVWARGVQDAVGKLASAEGDTTNAPFVSVFSFPDGHTKDGNIPHIDTLFIDFDFDEGEYERGSGDEDAWMRDMSHLLVRVRRVAEYIDEHGRAGWRASLSGHKGIHMYLDFEPVSRELGGYGKYVTGTNEFANDLIDDLADETGIDLDEYVDVTSSDLGRLCRVPNTLHGGASMSFGEERYCVPVTMDELADMTPDLYRALTREPRPVPWDERNPNAEVSGRLAQYISTATESLSSTRRSSSVRNIAAYEHYVEEVANDDITLSDVELLTSDRPCVWNFYERDDKWDYGVQSHNMEMYCIRELQEKNVPVDVMKQFFNSAPGYDEEYTEMRIREVISRDYERFRTDTMLRLAPEFMASEGCGRCQRIMEQQDITV